MGDSNLSTVNFNGHQLETFKDEGVEWVAVYSICEGMGLNTWSQQRKLMKKKDKFNYRSKAVVAQDGRVREIYCIPVKKVQGWLFTINPDRVKAEFRQAVELYQEECFEVLYDYWHNDSKAQAAPALPSPGKPTQLIDRPLNHLWLVMNPEGSTIKAESLSNIDALRNMIKAFFPQYELKQRGSDQKALVLTGKPSKGIGKKIIKSDLVIIWDNGNVETKPATPAHVDQVLAHLAPKWGLMDHAKLGADIKVIQGALFDGLKIWEDLGRQVDERRAMG